MATYNPKYTVAIIATKTSTKYNVTGAVLRLILQEKDGEIAQRVTLSLANVKVDGQYLSDIIDTKDRVFVYANDGERNEEVFRGFIWDLGDRKKQGKELSYTCYDNLIYFQESEEYQYFSAGYSTKSICSTICSKWGVNLSYTYSSITHPKLPLRGTLSDIFMSDLLDEVKKKTGKKYVMRSIQDDVHIDGVGQNTQIYKLYSGKDGNVTETNREKTMQGMVTKVIILGKEDDDERASIEATVKGDTDTYGTLQKILNSSSGTSLAEAKEEANELIKEKGKPKETFYVEAVDIPWIRKGDKVEIAAGGLSGYFIVISTEHSVNDKSMSLEVEKA